MDEKERDNFIKKVICKYFYNLSDIREGEKQSGNYHAFMTSISLSLSSVSPKIRNELFDDLLSLKDILSSHYFEDEEDFISYISENFPSNKPLI